MEKELPEGWVEGLIKDVSDVTSGIGFPLEFQGNTFGNIPFYKVGDISQTVQSGKYILTKANNYIDEDTKGMLKGKLFPKGSIVFAKIGEALKLNRRAILSQPSLVDNNVMVVIPKENCNSLYLFHFLKTQDLTLYSAGNSVPSVRKGSVENIKIPLAPLPEQERIVTKLDSIFAHLEVAKQGLEKIPVLLKEFRQAVLTQAVTGKLTEEWREGKQLPLEILISKKNKTEFEIIKFEKLPKNWLQSALGNYAECSRGKFSARPRNDPKYFDGIYPFMQIGDLPREGGVTRSFSKTLNEHGIQVSKCFPEGTVVIAIVGATIGITGILDEQMYFPDSLIGINCRNRISNQYLEFYLRVCKYGLREISYAGGGQPNIKITTITGLEFLIPPIEEQTEIVRRVEALFSKADAIEAQYKIVKEQIDQLPRAVLAKAFRGEV